MAVSLVWCSLRVKWHTHVRALSFHRCAFLARSETNQRLHLSCSVGKTVKILPGNQGKKDQVPKEKPNSRSSYKCLHPQIWIFPFIAELNRIYCGVENHEVFWWIVRESRYTVHVLANYHRKRIRKLIELVW